VPFFDIMREPQKFLMLLVLAYAVGLGWGVQRLGLMRVSARRAGWVAAAIGLALPLAYSPTIFDGLAGQIGPSTLPLAVSGWSASVSESCAGCSSMGQRRSPW